MELSRLCLHYLFSFEVLIELHCSLILIEDLLVLLIFVLPLPQLKPVVLANSKYISFVSHVETMLKASRNTDHFLICQRLDKYGTLSMDVIASSQLSLE